MVTWQDVTQVLIVRWPAQKWDRAQLAGYIAEMQVDGLSPETAMLGIRASTSEFVPPVGRVKELAWAAQGPPKLSEIHEAQRRRGLGP